MATKKELIRLAKLYLYLGIFGAFVFLMTKPLSVVSKTMDNNLVEIAKVSVQSIVTNQNIKQVGMLFLILYTVFVVIESLVFIRDCGRRFCIRNKEKTEENS